MRRVGAPGFCRPESRWGRSRGMMYDRMNRGHYTQTLNAMTPAAWWEAEDVMPGAVSSWPARVGTALVQAVVGLQPTAAKAPTGVPGVKFISHYVSLATGLFDTKTAFTIASTASDDNVAAQGAIIIQHNGAWWTTATGVLQQVDTIGRTGSGARGDATNWKAGSALAPSSIIQSRIDTHDLLLAGPDEVEMYYNGVYDPYSVRAVPNNTIAVGAGVTDVGGNSGATVAYLVGWIITLVAFYRVLTILEIKLLDNLIAWQANI